MKDLNHLNNVCTYDIFDKKIVYILNGVEYSPGQVDLVDACPDDKKLKQKLINSGRNVRVGDAAAAWLHFRPTRADEGFCIGFWKSVRRIDDTAWRCWRDIFKSCVPCIIMNGNGSRNWRNWSVGRVIRVPLSACKLFFVVDVIISTLEAVLVVVVVIFVVITLDYDNNCQGANSRCAQLKEKMSD